MSSFFMRESNDRTNVNLLANARYFIDTEKKERRLVKSFDKIFINFYNENKLKKRRTKQKWGKGKASKKIIK